MNHFSNLLSLLSSLTFLAGCTLDLPSGVFACTNDDECPSGFSCGADDRCYRGELGGGTRDAGGQDAGMEQDGGDGGSRDGGDGGRQDAGMEQDSGGSEVSLAIEPKWLRVIGGPGQDAVVDCDVGADGVVFAVGRVENDAVFDEPTSPSADPHGAFVARFSPAGEYEHLSFFGGTVPVGLETVEVAGSSVYAAGNFWGTVDWGGGERTATMADAIVLSLTSDDLTYQWEAVGVGDGRGRVIGLGLGGGDLYVTGLLDAPGPLEFAGCAPAMSPGAEEDAFVARLDPGSGQCSFIDSFGGVAQDRGQVLAVPAGANRRIFVGGRAAGVPIDAPSDFEPLVRAYSLSGAAMEAPDFPFVPYGAAHVGAGACMAGFAISNISYDGQVYPTMDMDGFITCVNDTFTPLWTAHVTGEGEERFRALAHDNGIVVGSGRFTRAARLGGLQLDSTGSYDALLAAYDADDGTLLGADLAVSGSGDVITFGIGISGRTVCVAGEFTGEITVGNTTFTSVASSGDAFVATYELVDR